MLIERKLGNNDMRLEPVRYEQVPNRYLLAINDETESMNSKQKNIREPNELSETGWKVSALCTELVSSIKAESALQ